MKITSAWNDFKKPKSAQSSKKTSQATSLIYREIGLQMEKLTHHKNPNPKDRTEMGSRQSKDLAKMTITNTEEEKQSSKKINSFNSMKKKTSINLSNY